MNNETLLALVARRVRVRNELAAMTHQQATEDYGRYSKLTRELADIDEKIAKLSDGGRVDER